MKVNYQSVGSGGGQQQLKQKTVDFAGSDAPVSDEEMKDWPGEIRPASARWPWPSTSRA